MGRLKFDVDDSLWLFLLMYALLGFFFYPLLGLDVAYGVVLAFLSWFFWKHRSFQERIRILTAFALVAITMELALTGTYAVCSSGCSLYNTPILNFISATGFYLEVFSVVPYALFTFVDALVKGRVKDKIVAEIKTLRGRDVVNIGALFLAYLVVFPPLFQSAIYMECFSVKATTLDPKTYKFESLSFAFRMRHYVVPGNGYFEIQVDYTFHTVNGFNFGQSLRLPIPFTFSGLDGALYQNLTYDAFPSNYSQGNYTINSVGFLEHYVVGFGYGYSFERFHGKNNLGENVVYDSNSQLARLFSELNVAPSC